METKAATTVILTLEHFGRIASLLPFRHPFRRLAVPCALLASLALTACADIRREPFTAAQQQDAQIAGIPDARFWNDAPDAPQRMLPPISKDGESLTMLALSGGGDNGAFGAGLLNGWSETGTRPEFSIVTGVSTGALIAPFAFLGSRYDATLADLFTHVSGDDIYRSRFPLAFLWTTSLYDTAPLAEAIRTHVTDTMIEEVAAEHARGRRLFVATANLDAQRMTIWDMGAIAASHTSGSHELFRRVMLASSAIPALFPPVMIDSVAQGKTITEMHVDGGATAQIFAAPNQAVIDDRRPIPGPPGRIKIYLVVNSKLGGDFHIVEPRTIPILAQSFSLDVESSLYSLVSTNYLFARDHGIDFNLAYIHNDFPTAWGKYFDTAQMRKLFAYGVQRGRDPQVWDKRPPGQSELLKTPAKHQAATRGPVRVVAAHSSTAWSARLVCRLRAGRPGVAAGFSRARPPAVVRALRQPKHAPRAGVSAPRAL
jgi:hypothetical protein